MFISKKAVIAGASALVLVGGGAYAAFTVTGTGSGSATTAAFANGSLTLEAGNINGLYPGHTVSAPLSATNKGGAPLVLQTVVGEVSNTGIPSCGPSMFEVTGSPTAVVIPNDFTKVQRGTVSVKMKTEAGNECQGATITVKLYGTATTP